MQCTPRKRGGEGFPAIYWTEKGEEDMAEKLLSVLVPCYNEEAVLPLFYAAITKLADDMKETDFEFLFINDGSQDETLELLRELHRKDKRVRFLSFSRNFGKEAAIYAGLGAARGDYIVLLDADLQHPPEYIEQMYRIITEESYDSVAMRRVSRKGERRVRSFFSGVFYKIINKISHTNIMEGATDYRMMSRRMADAVLSLKEYHRFTKGIFSWVGFQTKWLEYENVERAAGTTKWSFLGLVRYSLEGITAFSTTPLVFASALGIFFCLLAFILGIVIFIKTLIWGDPVAGFPTLICVLLLLGGLQLLTMGIQGQYMAKTYLEVKQRPIYLVKETEEDMDWEECVEAEEDMDREKNKD